MKRWLPFPLFSLALLALWLVLNENLAAGHVLLGLGVAVAGGRMLAGLQPPTRRVHRRAGVAVRLLWEVFADVVRSNIAVGRIVFGAGARARARTAGFLRLPLAVRHPGALAVLACIITATPGTSWARYDAERNVVTIHVLDLIDADEWIRIFKQRYERRLQEIFE